MSLMMDAAAKARTDAATSRPIRVIDLADRPEYRALWTAPGATSFAPQGLPAGGWASTLGFWLAPLPEGAPPPTEGLLITFPGPSQAPSPPKTRAPGRRPTLTVRLKPTHTGDGVRILPRRRYDRDGASGRGLDIDVHRPAAGAADQAQVAIRSEHSLRHWRTLDDQDVVAVQQIDHLARAAHVLLDPELGRRGREPGRLVDHVGKHYLVSGFERVERMA